MNETKRRMKREGAEAGRERSCSINYKQLLRESREGLLERERERERENENENK